MKSADFHPETYRFAMEQALAAATKSDDLSTQVGATNHWDDDIVLGRAMLTESGVAVIDYDFPGIAIPPLRRNGELWMP